ncbi:MAG: hypothetical protein IKR45_03760 [Treponema sp.]|nr:hypothetical protein [Treponema sp.]
MKKIITLVAAAAMSFSLFGLDIFNYVQINGNVKNYTQIDYDIGSKFGNLTRTPVLKTITTLDNAGRAVEITELSARDAVISKIANKYDVYGNLTEQNAYDADSKLLWRNVNTYNNGQKADVSEYDKGGILKARTIFQYTDGKLADETGYDGDGALLWKIVYKYNPAGKLADVYEYAADGSLDIQETYTYSDDGRIDSLLTYDTYSEQTERKVFRYASNGTLSEITTYDATKQVTNRIIIKYDAGGNVSKVSEYNIAQKFGTTVNELIAMSEYTYQ